ncbi:microtubule-associated tyrosine carboxypeptidase-like [Liolophura sinensis]|uniref:microtubule-associated tyrosine carboxypeptidase-like n=1 Tax=Liolophura sinensis TaxID=3198878 RepID=UPI0031582A41
MNMNSKKARRSAQRIKSHEHGYKSPILPINFEDQKQRFFREGKPPEFVLRGSSEEVKKITSREKAVVRFDHLEEAERILNIVKSAYGDGNVFLDASFGPEITKETATKAVADYINDNNLDGCITITWCSDLACSATMMWQGPALKYNRPEARRYSLWLNDSRANTFLRERGITSLLHHEIGTHFFRMHNDGLQPWFSDRKRFRLTPMSSRKLVSTEEGLATINTVLDSRVQFLWTAALLYYSACKAEYMSFGELYEHLEKFVNDREQRWKHCIRVKRGLDDVNVPGGYGKDQCYLEGAIKILKDVDNIDFTILMAGKICTDEVQRCKRLARTDIIRLPQFMADMAEYKSALRQIAQINGIGHETIPKTPRSIHSKRSNKRYQDSRTPVQNIPKTTSVHRAELKRESVDTLNKSSRSVSGNFEMWHRLYSLTPQPFRYKHAPMPVSPSPFSPQEDSDPEPFETRASTTSPCDPERYIYSRSSSVSFLSSSDVRPASATSASRAAPDTPAPRGSHIVRPKDTAHEIRRYSERMLHRRKFKKSKPTGKRKKKALKKAKGTFPKVDILDVQPVSDEEANNSYRFGCLKIEDSNDR